MSRDIQFAESLSQSYENYREKSLNHRRFKHSDILPLINRLNESEIFRVKKVGASVQGREIFLISIGTGKKNIFCWSQMHGDEATGVRHALKTVGRPVTYTTMALGLGFLCIKHEALRDHLILVWPQW